MGGWHVILEINCRTSCQACVFIKFIYFSMLWICVHAFTLSQPRRFFKYKTSFFWNKYTLTVEIPSVSILRSMSRHVGLLTCQETSLTPWHLNFCCSSVLQIWKFTDLSIVSILSQINSPVVELTRQRFCVIYSWTCTKCKIFETLNSLQLANIYFVRALKQHDQG